ncbi:hypothetical protein SPRG_05301 [Saprolegnia parasitica CBS 223.65]|uniref:NOT2/NOT3/NOT5 C-terminal domain-containing protein n=1 Tax=Saprolegnia parasitica (strain CBS 223.65) TaxID=695850 RepID=A0A067CH96_SAPPC|nr:hypothetical protein SPRG_05301 [Saprolegnia parasitica CBS 223.65]KDO30109.1 hypothetical protein SPRG_05301 [Saprolegnia parasitica CBS 223.65]|eukprot:XP_012199289.1 hypothetical protein SPRG_05301 [Saprolegnia parasitica CBS 223.65]
MSVLDPSKDKLAYFKDNIQTAEDQEEFDASQYYYNRQDGFFKQSPGMGGTPRERKRCKLSCCRAIGDPSQAGLQMGMQPGVYPGYSSGAAQPQMASFLAATSTGIGMGSMGMAGMGMGGMAGMGMGSAVRSVPPTTPTASGLMDNYLASRIAEPATTPITMATKVRTFEKSPDMSEFPALTARSSSVDENSPAFRQNSEFVIQKEDFPALSSFGAEGRPTEKAANQGMSSSNDAMLQRTSQPSTSSTSSSIGSRSGTHVNATFANVGGFQSANNLAVNSFPPLHANDAKPHPSSRPSSSSSEETSRFGLLGMLHVIRATDPERNVAQGCDLTSLGLNLNSSEPLHPTFASPWSDTPCTKEPQYTLPLCYYNQPPVLKTSHLSKFQLETLFYIFYSMPKDVVQAYAAQELYLREWRYHMDLKLWFKRQQSESAALQYIYFDINTWERRLFGGNPSAVSAGFMTDDDVRVKFTPTP